MYNNSRLQQKCNNWIDEPSFLVNKTYVCKYMESTLQNALKAYPLFIKHDARKILQMHFWACFVLSNK